LCRTIRYNIPEPTIEDKLPLDQEEALFLSYNSGSHDSWLLLVVVVVVVVAVVMVEVIVPVVVVVVVVCLIYVVMYVQYVLTVLREEDSLNLKTSPCQPSYE
jgi:hypothetical protein